MSDSPLQVRRPNWFTTKPTVKGQAPSPITATVTGAAPRAPVSSTTAAAGSSRHTPAEAGKDVATAVAITSATDASPM
jgi:hypothetical protein